MKDFEEIGKQMPYRESDAEVDALLPQSSPGHIDTAAGEPLSPQERGARRLEIFRRFVGTQAVPERI